MQNGLLEFSLHLTVVHLALSQVNLHITLVKKLINFNVCALVFDVKFFNATTRTGFSTKSSHSSFFIYYSFFKYSATDFCARELVLIHNYKHS